MVEAKNTPIDKALFNKLATVYDKHLSVTEKTSDKAFFGEFLTGAIAEQSQNGKLVLSELQVETFNAFIRHHNGKFNNMKNPEFYQYAVVQDDNKNLFIWNRFESSAIKLEDHGHDSHRNIFSNVLYAKDLESMKKQAVAAVYNHSITGNEMTALKESSELSWKHDVSIISRRGFNAVLIHKEGGVGEVEMVAQCTRPCIPDKDMKYYSEYAELQMKAQKARAEKQSENEKGGRQ